MSSEFLEISFHVCVDSIHDRIYSRIIEEIGTIAPEIIKTTCTQGTNFIDVLAHLDESRVDKMLKDIRKIANVSDVVIDREKHLKNIIEPTVEPADCFSCTIKKDPIAEIIMALNAKQYYAAIDIACTDFQYLGQEILSCQAKSMGMISRTTDLNSVINGLLAEKLIDVKYSGIIQQARKLQKIYEHEQKGMKFSFDKSAEAELTISHSMECINFLKNKYYSIADKNKENNEKAVNSIQPG